MGSEKSCGAVVFTRLEREIRYVIIRHLGGHCGFPKGHMEPGEEENYLLPNKPGVAKQVVYFLAEYSGQMIHTQPEEVAQAWLLPYEEALSALTFREAREILKKAQQFLGE